jgi:hypothetical protein
MESLKQLVAQHSNGPLATRPPLTPRLSRSDSLALKTLFDQTLAYYPGQEFDAETLKGYQFDMGRLITRYGLPMFQEALLALRLRPGQKFFPHPTEIAEELESMTAKASLELRRQHPYQPCEGCCGTGYVVRVDEQGERAARRCICWLNWHNEHRRRQGVTATTTQSNDGKTAATGAK